MKHEKVLLFLISLLIVGVWVIAFQNAGLISPVSTPTVRVIGSVDVDNTVRVRGSVDVDNTVSIDTFGALDVNIAEVVGHNLVSSKKGMYIGVSSTENTIIPINWGEIGISR